MKPAVIIVEQPINQRAMAWKGHQQLHRRLGDVQEKPEPVAHAAPPEFAPERNKVIVMHPDEVVGFDQRGKRFGETGIDPLIAAGELSFVFGQIDPEMEHWPRSEEHTSELQSLMRISYAVFCLKKKNKK